MSTLAERLRLYGSMVRYGSAHNADFAREHDAFFRLLRREIETRRGTLAGQRVLDVGCGKSMWLTLLLHSAGARVTGIDTELTRPGLAVGKYWRMARCNGVERTLRTFAWDLFYARPYYRELERASGLELDFDRLDVRRESVTELEDPDDTYDLVVSHETFEHLPDVETALAVLRRAMKPDGLTLIYIHNFASLSGGHHIAWKYPDTEPSDQVPPWDHLRDNRFPTIPSWINRLRERDYRAAFERHFEIVEWRGVGREGETLLTPEIRRELADYDTDELLTKGFLVIARPRQDADADTDADAETGS